MVLLLRVGAYLLSGVTIWQFISGDTSNLGMSNITKHLILDTNNSMLLGVCAGISNYSGVDVTLIRFAWLASTLYRGLGIALYIIAFLVIPTI